MNTQNENKNENKNGFKKKIEDLKNGFKKYKKEIISLSAGASLLFLLGFYGNKFIENRKQVPFDNKNEEVKPIYIYEPSITDEYAQYMKQELNYIHEDKFLSIDDFILNDNYHKYNLEEFKYYPNLDNLEISIPLTTVDIYRLDYDINKYKLKGLRRDETLAIEPLLPNSLENEYKVRFRNIYNSSKAIMQILKYTDDQDNILKLMKIINNELWQEYSEQFIFSEIKNYPGILNIKGVQNVLETYMYKKNYGTFKYSDLESLIDFVKETKEYLNKKSASETFTKNPSFDLFFADLYSVYLRGWGIPLMIYYSNGMAIDKKNFEYLREYLGYSYDDINKIKTKIGKDNLEKVKKNWKTLDMLWKNQRNAKEEMALDLVAIMTNEIEQYLYSAVDKLTDFESEFYRFLDAEYGKEGILNYLKQGIQTINRILTKISYGYNYEKNIPYKNKLPIEINAIQDTGLYFNGEKFIREKYFPALNKILERYPELSKEHLFFGIEEFPGDLVKEYYNIVAKNKNGFEWDLLRREIENHYFYKLKN
ncbi:MAG: hypothetical protein QW210_01485 [Candidatus Woesearchaeota archaeon]